MPERRRAPEVNPRIALQKGWQGGPASIELEVDEILLDHNEDEGEPALMLKLESTTLPDPGATFELEIGTGKLTFPSGPGTIEFWVCASMPQARELRDALTTILEENSETP